jgi:hypothetical protein
MFSDMLQNMNESQKQIFIERYGSIEAWEKHMIEGASSEKVQKNYAKVVEWYVDLFRIGNGSQTDRLQVKAFTESDVWEIKETVKRFYSDVKTGRTSVGGFAMPVDVPGSNT